MHCDWSNACHVTSIISNRLPNFRIILWIFLNIHNIHVQQMAEDHPSKATHIILTLVAAHANNVLEKRVLWRHESASRWHLGELQQLLLRTSVTLAGGWSIFSAMSAVNVETIPETIRSKRLIPSCLVPRGSKRLDDSKYSEFWQ